MPVGQESPTRGMGVWAVAVLVASKMAIVSSILCIVVPPLVHEELMVVAGKAAILE